MARKTRIEFPGAVYHLLDRGDRREAIYRDETDRRRFLDTLGEVCRRTGWRVHAFVLMSNHYHLLVETPQPNLVAGMRWLQSTWAIRFNRRHRVSGHLFQGRYKSIVVDPEERSYLVVLSDYIHLNPVRAGLVKLEGRLFDYQWSSYPLAAARARPEWFEPSRVLGELDLPDTAAGRKNYAGRIAMSQKFKHRPRFPRFRFHGRLSVQDDVGAAGLTNRAVGSGPRLPLLKIICPRKTVRTIRPRSRRPR